MTLGLDPLSLRLATPATPAGPAELAQAWYHQDLILTVDQAPDLPTDHRLAGKLRGAIGRELMRAASPATVAGQPCPWHPPCALDPLFVERKLPNGRPVPKPWIIRLAAARRRITIVIRVFGFATDWMPALAEAATAALQDGLRDRDGQRQPFNVVGRTLVEGQGIIPPRETMRSVTLAFRTPLSLRSGGSVAQPGWSLIASLGLRLDGLARWQDRSLAVDWKRLRADCAGIAFDDAAMHETAWHRGSGRQPQKIPMGGRLGPLRLAGDLAPLIPLLQLGATCHVGSHAMLGLGAYDLMDAR